DVEEFQVVCVGPGGGCLADCRRDCSGCRQRQGRLLSPDLPWQGVRQLVPCQNKPQKRRRERGQGLGFLPRRGGRNTNAIGRRWVRHTSAIGRWWLRSTNSIHQRRGGDAATGELSLPPLSARWQPTRHPTGYAPPAYITGKCRSRIAPASCRLWPEPWLRRNC